MTTITVSSSTQLYNALALAKGGETIQLRPGDYGNFSLGGKSGFDITFPSTVTITSLDAKNPAVFTGLSLSGAANVAIRNVTFDYTFTAGQIDDYRPNEINGSANIAITGSRFAGDVASNSTASANGFGTGIGLSVRGSSNVTVSNNEFSNWKRGMVVDSSSKLVVTGNDVHDIRSDGMNFVAVQGVRIENNYLHDFRASYASGDHRDMIQFWTNGTTTPSTDIVIRNNRLDIGEGSYAQSIFMRNEEVDNGRAGVEMYYRNVLIENNTIYNGHLHGITVAETAGLTIRNNSLIAVPDLNNPEQNSSTVWVPAINVDPKSTTVVIQANVTAAVSGPSGQADWTVLKNAIIQDSDPFKAGHYSQVFIGSTLDAEDGVHRYVALQGSVIESLGAGSAATRHATVMTGTEAYFKVTEDPNNGAVRTFDAGLMAKLLGTADLGTAYYWDFGDGTTAEGKVVSHTFATPGRHEVKLILGLPNGTLRTADADIDVQGPKLLAFNGSKGAFDAYVLGEATTLAPISRLDGAAIQLGAPGTTATVSRAMLKDLRGADDFTLDFTLKGDAAGGAGEVFRQHGVFVGTMTSTGQLNFQITTSDGKTTTLTTAGLKLNDGLAHDVSIQFKGGLLQIAADGQVNLERPLVGTLTTAGSTDLIFGNPWGRTNYSGDLSKFAINVDTGDYPAQPLTKVLVHDTFDGVFVPPPPPPPPPPLTIADDTGMHAAGWAGKVFDLGSYAGNTAVLIDNAYIGATPDGPVLYLDGNRDHALLGRQTAYEKSDRVGFSVDFKRDVADGSTDRLIWNHMKVGLTLTGDGLQVQVATLDQGFKSYAAREIGLNDTDLHRAEVMVDTIDDRLQVVVDGKVVIDVRDADFEMEGAGGRENGWMIGTPWDRYFDGEVHDFRLGDRFDFLEGYVPAPNALLA